MVSYLVALDPTFSSPLLFEQFCLYNGPLGIIQRVRAGTFCLKIIHSFVFLCFSLSRSKLCWFFYFLFVFLFLNYVQTFFKDRLQKKKRFVKGC